MGMGLARGLVGLGLRPSSSATDVVMVEEEGAGEATLPLLGGTASAPASILTV